MVGSIKNIFVSKNTVSCNKFGDTISTIGFEVTIDNQHVDSVIVTYQHRDLLMSFFFIALQTRRNEKNSEGLPVKKYCWPPWLANEENFLISNRLKGL